MANSPEISLERSRLFWPRLGSDASWLCSVACLWQSLALLVSAFLCVVANRLANPAWILLLTSTSCYASRYAGPVLAFSKAVVMMSESMDVPFLAFNAWVSVWLCVYCIIASVFDGSRVIRLCTRFTDEAFALLIVSIFIMDAVGDPFSDVGILRYFMPTHPSHQEQEEGYDYMTVALLSTILGFGTTALIFFFRSFKTSSYFCNQTIRTSIHDFAVVGTVIISTCVSMFLFPEIQIETLAVPNKFEPSYQCCDTTCMTFFPTDCPGQEAAAGSRSWMVDWFDLNGKGYIPIAAAGPAILAFILVYLDCGITWHLILHPSHKLAHGEAYNYDLILVGICNLINGSLGLPWLVATTVPCLVHLHALGEKDNNGKFVSVQETRLTGFAAHFLVGISLILLNILALLPMPVLYGVFFFMGLASLGPIQMWHRVLLWFQQPSLYSETCYTKYMEKKRVHWYTMMQLVMFGLIFVVQNVPSISIVFPIMTLLCIPCRMFLFPRVFAGWELELLDGDDDTIAQWIELKEKSMTPQGALEWEDVKKDPASQSVSVNV
jgi:HCO3- transporter family